AITLTLGTNFAQPVVLSLPSCFAYGAASSGTPTISAILPSSGTNDGNTRVTIVGSGFSTTSGVQVFFGAVEANVVSVSFNQVVVLSPPAFGAGAENLNATVQVTVRNIGSGVVSNGVDFRFTPAVQITAISNNVQRTDLPFTAVTIYGQGFDAPVAVGLAGVAAIIQSVSATEIVVLPVFPLLSGCSNLSGDVTVTNINTGDSAAGQSFTYIVPPLVITDIDPAVGVTGDQVEITGVNFPQSVADAEVKFGSRTAFVTSSTPGSIFVTVPPGSVTTPPVCILPNTGGDLQDSQVVDVTVTDRATGCTATVTQAFTYQLPCVDPTPVP
ncbi:MAG: IPT/TIG domain-containing protein, partial [Thermoanaerobaculia bacterium]